MEIAPPRIFKIEDSGETTELASITTLTPIDTFIFLDDWNRKLYVWLGRDANVRARFTTARAAQAIRNESGMVFKIDTINQGDEPDSFIKFLKDIGTEISRSSTTPRPEPEPMVKPKPISVSPQSQPLFVKTQSSSQTPALRQPKMEKLTTDLKFSGNFVGKWSKHYEEVGVSPGEAAEAIRWFSEGLPLPPNISDKSTNDFLVRVSEVERSLDDFEKMIRDAEITRGYLFVIGSYGTGKSQLKNLMIEKCTIEFEKVIVIDADLGLDFATFTQDFFETIERSLKVSDSEFYYQEIEPVVAKGKEASSAKEENSAIVEIFKKLIKSRKIHCIALLYDETDKILGIDDFKIWSDFITALHDMVHSHYIMVFYSTDQAMDRIFWADTRFERFSKWLDVPYELSTSFEEHLFEGLANLFVLKSIAQRKPVSEFSLRMIDYYIKIHEAEFQNTTFRRINVHVLSLLNYLDQMHALGIIDNLKKYKDFSVPEIRKEQQGKLLSIIGDISINFEHVDENYAAKFVEEPDSETVGHYHLGKAQVEDQLGKTYPVFVVFDVNTSLLRVDRVSSTTPTIAFSFLDLEHFIALKESFKKKIADHDLLLINFDERIFEPLLLYPKSITDSQTRRHARILRNWFNATLSIRTMMIEWLTAQAEKERSAIMEAEIAELKSLIMQIQQAKVSATPQKTVQATPTSAPSATPTETSSETPTEVTSPSPDEAEIPISSLALTVIISAFELVKMKKAKKSLMPNLVKDLIKVSKKLDLTVSKEEAQSTLQKVISDLLDKQFLEIKGKFYQKTDNWSKAKILSSLI